MAYTQNPGRGNSAKTGHGVPTPFKQEIELTTDYERGKKRLAKARAEGGKNYTSAISSIEGITVDPASGLSTVNPYEKKFLPGSNQGGKRTRAMITSGDKKVKEAAEGAAPTPRANTELYREYKRDSTNTMQSRNRNAKLYNITSGSKNPNLADAEEKKMLIGLGRATPVRMKKC
jgi:hypothetical protein